jgi:hypothetical protein
MQHIEALTRNPPAALVSRIKYDALCLNLRQELERACGFLEVGFNEVMLQPTSAKFHYNGGCPIEVQAEPHQHFNRRILPKHIRSRRA